MFEKIKNSKLFSNFKFQISNFLEVGFYLFIFLLPWQTHLIIRPGEWHGKFGGAWPVDYWQIALFGADILLIALLILAGIVQLKNNKGLAIKKKSWLLIILGLFDLAVFVSIAFAPDKALAVYKYLSFILALGLFWLASSNFYSKAKASVALVLALAIQGAFSIGQFFMQGSPAFKWLGLALHSAVDPGASVIETLGADGHLERWLRSYGSLDHPNMLGGFLAIGSIFLFQIILNHKRKDKVSTDWKFIIYHLSFIIVLTGLFFTFSRSAILATGVGLGILFIEAVWKKEKSKITRSLKTGLFVSLLLVPLLFTYSNIFLVRTSPGARLEVKSVAERQLYWQDSQKLIKNSHWLGVGVGNYETKLSRLEPDRIYYQWQPVHNVFVLILTETGIFGFLSFTAFFAGLLFLSLRRNVFNLSVCLALCIIMILDHYLWSLHFGLMFFCLVSGLLMRNFEDNKE
jgi:hypothetical protein